MGFNTARSQQPNKPKIFKSHFCVHNDPMLYSQIDTPGLSPVFENSALSTTTTLLSPTNAYRPQLYCGLIQSPSVTGSEGYCTECLVDSEPTAINPYLISHPTPYEETILFYSSRDLYKVSPEPGHYFSTQVYGSQESLGQQSWNHYLGGVFRDATDWDIPDGSSSYFGDISTMTAVSFQNQA